MMQPPKKIQSTNALRWGKRDAILCVCFAVAAAWLIWIISENLSYRWNWAAAWGYVISVSEEGDYQVGLLLSGLAASIRLLILAGALSLIIGAVVAALLLSPFRMAAMCYVESLRNLPPIVFIFIFFYFISSQLFNALDVGAFFAKQDDNEWLMIFIGDPGLAENFIGGVVCLALFEGAFFAVIIRAGILSVERGQWDAARSIGLGRWHTLRWVIFPQALKNTAAPMAGQLILLIKDSAILSVISVPELTFNAQEASVSSRQIFEVWLLAAVFYFALCWPLLKLADKLEQQNGNELTHRLPG